ncbi:LCP family protein [Sinomonas sp. JGH33]|uniref:LCP family protein n=1 Tax=Sinomonas terricola TaxID=3110330 RepID=A0ABU5T1X7_9MICC|nr:LCP family protein [Sinomonas sp. JGH33]MEA5453667.1 LCP family protein [Sinomonas sp. JGH33]
MYVLLSALLVVVLAAVAALIYLGTLSRSFDTQTKKLETVFPSESARPPAASPAADGKAALNILLVGSDSRDATIFQAESGTPSNQRSDTMMVVHVPADRKNVYVISIMRDLWVPIPGHGSAKINAALAFGGVPLMVQTIESVLGQRLDHVVFMDFEGFKSLTDAVGGVPVTVPKAFTAQQSGNTRFEAGTQTMNGTQALAFVRERYAFPDGDYQRVRNQQIFLKALVTKLATPQTLANPVTLANVVNELSSYLTVDSGFNSGAVVSLGLELGKVRPGDIVTFTLPTNGTGWSPDSQQSIVLFNQPATSGLADAMAKGTMPQYVADNKLQNGN